MTMTYHSTINYYVLILCLQILGNTQLSITFLSDYLGLYGGAVSGKFVAGKQCPSVFAVFSVDTQFVSQAFLDLQQCVSKVPDRAEHLNKKQVGFSH